MGPRYFFVLFRFNTVNGNHNVPTKATDSIPIGRSFNTVNGNHNVPTFKYPQIPREEAGFNTVNGNHNVPT